MEKDIIILEEISTGKRDLKNYSDEDKTKLLSDFNPKVFIKNNLRKLKSKRLLQKRKNPHKRNQKYVIQQTMQNKLKMIK